MTYYLSSLSLGNCSRSPQTSPDLERSSNQGRYLPTDPRGALAVSINLRTWLSSLPANNSFLCHSTLKVHSKSFYYASDLCSPPRKSCRKMNSDNSQDQNKTISNNRKGLKLFAILQILKYHIQYIQIYSFWTLMEHVHETSINNAIHFSPLFPIWFLTIC